MSDDQKTVRPGSESDSDRTREPGFGLGSAQQLLDRIGRLARQAKQTAESLAGRLLPERLAGEQGAQAEMLPSRAVAESAPEPKPEPEPEPEHELDHDVELGEVRVVLLARDPEWLFCYWDIAADLREASRPPSSRLTLRLQDVTDLDFDGTNGWSQHLYPLTEEARWWHVPVPHAGRHYLAEVGYSAPSGAFVLLGRSEGVATLLPQPADPQEEELATVHMDAPLPDPPPYPGDEVADEDPALTGPVHQPADGPHASSPGPRAEDHAGAPGRPAASARVATPSSFASPSPAPSPQGPSSAAFSHPGSSAIWSPPR